MIGKGGRSSTDPWAMKPCTVGFCTTSTATMTPTAPATTVPTTLSSITEKNTRGAVAPNDRADADLADALPDRHQRDVDEPEPAEQQHEHADAGDDQLDRQEAGRRRRA